MIKLTLIFLLLSACTGIPNGVQVIDNFEINRYLGTWYEIARLDHPFERGLDNISAKYQVRSDGGIDIFNKGRKINSLEWNQAEGVGYFIDKTNVGRLKVSFWGPFYGAYNIIALDKQNYSYAMITGPDKNYLWILSRTPKLAPEIQESLIAQAKNLGYATEKLIFVAHQP